MNNIYTEDRAQMLQSFCIFFLCIVGTTVSNLYASSLTITQSGRYGLGNNITYTPAGTDQIIYINANNVTLDLGNTVLSQSGGSGTLNGIEIAPGVYNVTIQNGTIVGTSGAGIFINNGCRNITIQNIQTFTTNQGIVLNGTTANNISNCKAKNIKTRYSTNQGFVINNSSAISLDNIVIDTCATTTFAIQCSGTQQSSLSLNNVVVNKSGLGIQVTGYQNVILNNCRIYKCTYTGSFKGFSIAATSGNTNKDILLQQCIVDLCTATGACTCFDFVNTLNSNVINCIASNCSGTADPVYGFSFAQCQNMSSENCTASSISTSGTQCMSFYLSGSSQITLNNCSSFSSGQNGLAYGVFYTDGTCSNAILKSCIVNTVNSGSSNLAGFYLNGTGIFAQDCTVITNSTNRGIYVSGSNVITDNCAVFYSNASFTTLSSSGTATNCILQSPFIDGYSPQGASCVFKNCISCAAANNGFTITGSNNNVFESCTAAFSSVGFAVSGSSGNIFYNNNSVRNTSNYSGVTNTASAGGTVTVGVNLSGL